MPATENEKSTLLETTKKRECTNSIENKTDKVILQTFILITCIKILLIPTYHSTDFEVHRNWLAITYNLPVAEWYINAKSQWTLDYPPLFAWFEYTLSQIAYFFDPEMLKVDNLNYDSPQTVLFQRSTVMFADLMFAYGVREITKIYCKSSDARWVFIFLSLCNIGLLVVDHIHFQYNGFLLGILMLSIAKVSETRRKTSMLQGAAWFCILLNLKHLYLYVAPAYFIWLLKYYCLKDGQFFKRIFTLGFVILLITAISFGPFITQITQVLSRLFPFKRGLVHAYWAANSWALYIAVDKILAIIGTHSGWISGSKRALMTGGLVQEESFIILPTPTPIFTIAITFLAMCPIMWSLFHKKESIMAPRHLVRAIVLCALSSFMFSWHVHEKAILTAIIPLCMLAVTDIKDAKFFIILSSAGHTALLPLLYPSNLIPLKLLLLLTYTLLMVISLSYRFKQPLLYLYEWVYVGVLPLITIYESLLHKVFWGEKLPFLPLALTSVYCAVGVTYTWIFYYYIFLSDHGNNDNEKKRKHKKKDVNSLMNKKQKLL